MSNETSVEKMGWIGVDLDGTLAEYDGWRGPTHIGPPIQPMLDRVKRWLEEGRDVRIMTARVSSDDERQLAIPTIEDWLRKHVGQTLPLTHCKDYEMVELWDDRAVQVIPNTGERVDDYVARFEWLRDIVDQCADTVHEAHVKDSFKSFAKRLGAAMYVVELEPGVWLARGPGDPARTLNRGSARLYGRKQDARAGLTRARKYRLFKNARILKYFDSFKGA